MFHRANSVVKGFPGAGDRQSSRPAKATPYNTTIRHERRWAGETGLMSRADWLHAERWVGAAGRQWWRSHSRAIRASSKGTTRSARIW